MPIRKKPVDRVPILLKRVTEVIARATESNQTDAVLPSFTKIETDLNEIKDGFPKLNHWEEELMGKFISLEQDIDDDIFENGNGTQIHDKLSSINKNLQEIKSLVNMLPITHTQAELRGQSKALAKNEVSAEWLGLELEDNILVSPAIANLKLSYDALGRQFKLCLLCFAIFPEKAVIKKKPLIYWWIGEGLASKSRDKTAEEAGEEIFEKLIKKGLLQAVRKNKKSPIVDCCTMHPWIRRMLVSVATKAQFFDFKHTGEIDDAHTKSRRACLASGNQGFKGNINTNSNPNNFNPNPNPNPNSEDEELLTMFNVDEHYPDLRTELFLKFKKLVILHLGRWQTDAKHHIEVENVEFLKELRAQRHLKYLSLQGISRITAIPDTISECINLEILDLRACHNLESLADISRLGKLTHLDVSECYLLESMPKGLENLYSLQVLKGFVIGHSRKNPCKLGDLAKLKKLRKLSIHIENGAFIDEEVNELKEIVAVELSKLKDIETLRVLTISWGEVVIPSAQSSTKATNSGGGGAPSQQKKEAGQLNRTRTATSIKKSISLSLSLPPKLEKLDLRCFPRQMSPEWLKPSNLEDLKRLYIRGGELASLITETDKTWKVKILRLKYLNNFKIEGSYLQKEFPHLIYFEKFRCNKSQHEEDVEWNKDEGWDAITH